MSVDTFYPHLALDLLVWLDITEWEFESTFSYWTQLIDVDLIFSLRKGTVPLLKTRTYSYYFYVKSITQTTAGLYDHEKQPAA